MVQHYFVEITYRLTINKQHISNNTVFYVNDFSKMLHFAASSTQLYKICVITEKIHERVCLDATK